MKKRNAVMQKCSMLIIFIHGGGFATDLAYMRGSELCG